MELSKEQLNRIFTYLDGMYSTRLDHLDCLARKNANALASIKIQIDHLTETINSLFISQNYKLNSESLTANFSEFFKTVIKEPGLNEHPIPPSTIKKINTSKKSANDGKRNIIKHSSNNLSTKFVSPKKPQYQTSNKTVSNGFIKKMIPLKTEANNFKSLLIKKTAINKTRDRSINSLKSLNSSFKSDRSLSSQKYQEQKEKKEKSKPPKTPRQKSEARIFDKTKKYNLQKKASKSQGNLNSNFSNTEKNIPALSFEDNSYSSFAQRKKSYSSYHPKERQIILKVTTNDDEKDLTKRNYDKNNNLLEFKQKLNKNSPKEPKEEVLIDKINAQYEILNNILNSNISPSAQKMSLKLEEIIEEEVKIKKEEETEEFLRTEEKIKTEGREIEELGNYDEDEIM